MLSRRAPARLASRIFSLAALAAAAVFAAPSDAFAQFAATKFSPNPQTVNVGTNFTTEVVVTDPAGGYALNGVEVWINFDASKLQAVSLSTGAGSPWTTVGISQIDNSNGKLRYKATGGTINGASVTVAKIVFTPIAAGATVLDIANVNTDIVGSGPFGVNGLAVDGSVTINPPLVTQTLTIAGGLGNSGDIAANVEYFNPATNAWQPAYLASYAAYGQPVTHPWGALPGTNRWINYRVDGGSEPGAGPTTANTLWYSYRVRFNVPADAQEARMTFSLKADNFAKVWINGVSTGPVIDGTADQLNADAVFSQNVHPGQNTIAIDVGDYGGLNGFNFLIKLSVLSAAPLEIVPVTPPDTTPPVITAPVAITKEATGPSGAAVTFVPAPTATDAVSGSVPVLASPISGSTFEIGTTDVQLSAIDAAGNRATASFPVTVQDTTPPAIGATPVVAPVEATGPGGAAVSFTVPTATDIVDGSVNVTASPASGSTFGIATTTVTLSASDSRRNSASKTFSVTVQDTTAPAIGAAPVVAPVEATGPAGAAVSFTVPSATDIVDGTVNVTASPASGSTFPIATTSVTLSASDTRNNSASKSFAVTVRDTTPPAIGAAPVVAPVEATGPNGAAVSFPVPSATDIVDGSVNVTATPASGSTFAIATTSVTLSASDSRNNSASKSFPITVRDTTPPAIGAAPVVPTTEATSPAGAVVTFAVPSATDIVDGTVNVTATPASGSTFAIGTTTVTLSSVDSRGNGSSSAFNVTVVDTTPPTITSVTPSTATLWPPNHQMVAIRVAATATDLASAITSLKIIGVTSNEPDNGLGDGDTAGDIQITGDLTLNLRAERGGKGNGRVYTITVEARDSYGNASTRTCTVSVPKSQGGK